MNKVIEAAKLAKKVCAERGWPLSGALYEASFEAAYRELSRDKEPELEVGAVKPYGWEDND